MTVTTLDERAALVVIDLQKGILAHPSAHPVAEVLASAAALAAAFRRADLPVVLVRVGGLAPGRTEQELTRGPRPDDWAVFAPELDQQPSDHVLEKKAWGAFTDTELGNLLQGQGVTQIVLAGIATSLGVESTARQSYELGFNVTLAVDAMTDRSGDAHRNSTEHIFPRLGETGAAAEIIAMLAARAEVAPATALAEGE